MDPKQFMVFTVADRLYATELKDVTRVVQLEKIYKVPLIKENFEGLIRFEDRAVPLFNVARAMGIERSELSRERLVSVEQINGEDIGLLIDHVEMVVTIDSGYFSDLENKVPYVKKKAIWEGLEIFLLNSEGLIHGESENC